MKKITILVALAGGITGILVFCISRHIKDGTMSVMINGRDFIYLFISVAVFSVLNTILWLGASVFFAGFFKSETENEMKKNALIFSIPYLLILAVPVLWKFYFKMANLKLNVLGAVYKPWGGFVHFNPAGYFLLLMLGFIIMSVSFLLILRFTACMLANGYGKKDVPKIILASLFLFYAITTTYITVIYPPTGDEPHYLIIAQSIVDNFSVNLEKSYAIDKSYRAFYPVELEYKNIHNTHDKNGNGIYSMHSIGLPILIALFYKIGGRIFVQLLMNFFTALLIVVFYLFLKKTMIENELAYLASMVLGLTVPVLIDSSLVLTEIPAAVIILYSFYVLYEYKPGASRLASAALFAGIAFMPWMHSKLFLFSAVFYAYYYFNIIRHRDFDPVKETINNLIIAVSMVLFICFYFSIYGKFAPAALMNITQSTSFYFMFSVRHAAKAFFAILFDRSYGIFPYNLFFITAVWGVMLYLKRKQLGKLTPFILIVPYFGMFLFWNDWGGSITPARQMIPILPVFAIYGVYFIQQSGFIKTKFFKIISWYSLIVSYMLMVFPVLRYIASKEKIYPFLDRHNLLWFLPNFYDNIGLKHMITVVYFIAIILLFFKYAPKEKNEN